MKKADKHQSQCDEGLVLRPTLFIIDQIGQNSAKLA